MTTALDWKILRADFLRRVDGELQAAHARALAASGRLAELGAGADVQVLAAAAEQLERAAGELWMRAHRADEAHRERRQAAERRP